MDVWTPERQQGFIINHSRSFMKTIFTVGMLLLAFSTAAHAQDESTIRYKQGASALLFTLNGLSDLQAGNYMGGVGASTFLADNIAIRCGLGFGSNTVSKNNTTEDETTVTTFNVAPGARYNLFNNTNVALFAGGQAMFGLAQTKNSVGGGEISSSTTTTLGASLFAGAEWFAWRNVSLSVEYGLGFVHSSERVKDANGVERDGPATTDVTMGISNINFTLGLYFN
ncbi:MAG: porin family protein [Candidatus Kapabacteria bacterium]|nr:porin family protein [Candidatus Kapabacteria bacterium]